MPDAHQNLIDRTCMPGDHLTENRNPSALTDLIGHYAAGTAADVDRAAQAATAALPAWQAKGPLARAELLDRIARRIDAEADVIGRMLAREEGKILPEAMAEVRRAAQIFRFFGGEALRIAGGCHRLGPAGCGHCRDARTAWRHWPDHAVELPRRHSGVEGGARPCLWQCGHPETRRSGARHGALACPHHP